MAALVHDVAVVSLDFDGCTDILFPKLRTTLKGQLAQHNSPEIQERLSKSRNALIEWLSEIERKHESVVITCGSNRQSLGVDQLLERRIDPSITKTSAFKSLDALDALDNYNIANALKVLNGEPAEKGEKKWSVNRLLIADVETNKAPGSAWKGDTDFIIKSGDTLGNRLHREQEIWKNDIIKYQIPLASSDFYFIDDRSKFLDAQRTAINSGYIEIPPGVTVHLCHYDWFGQILEGDDFKVDEKYTMNDLNVRLKNLPSDPLSVVNTFLGGEDQLSDIVANITDYNMNESLKTLGEYLKKTTGIVDVHDDSVRFRTSEWVIRPVVLNRIRQINLNNLTNGKTALYRASSWGHLDIVNLLLTAGADVNKMNKKRRTPLYIASKKGHVDIVNLLLYAGADMDIADIYDKTPLYIASKTGHVDIINLLLSAGANVNKGDLTPLYIASEERHLDIVKLLLSAGADVNKVNSNGETPLCIASWNGSLDIVKLLLDAGADPKKTTGYGKTPLHFAFEKLLRQLFISLANKTPLDAAFCESLDIVKLLSTVDVNKWNDDDKELMNWNFYIRAIKEILSNITVNADVITMLKILNDEEITRMAMEKYAKQSNATLGKRKSPGYLDLKF